MSLIVCGRFDTTVAADAALASLRREGFQPAEIDDFYVSPPGMNQLNPTGGDAPHSSEGSRNAGRGAVMGAVFGLVVGFVAGMIASTSLGTPAIFLGALLGAFVGAFAGTMNTLRAGRKSAATIEHPVESRGGRMIAVNVDRAGTERVAMDLLARHGARDVGRTQGRWLDGSWQDFDPRTPLAA